MGGKVYIPPGFIETGQGATRVLYKDPTTGSTSGLAMSRSLGDWDAGEVGVIPDPMIDILDIAEIKKKVLENLNDACKDTAKEVEINPINGEPSPVVDACIAYTEKDVKVFAISATDGLLDYLPEQDIVQHVAKGLYETKEAGIIVTTKYQHRKQGQSSGCANQAPYQHTSPPPPIRIYDTNDIPWQICQCKQERVEVKVLKMYCSEDGIDPRRYAI